MMTQTSTNTLIVDTNTPAASISLERVMQGAILAQGARLTLALTALAFYDNGQLPVMVTVAALLDGVLVGGTSAVAAAMAGMGRMARLAAKAWSMVGLFSLAHVLARVAAVAQEYPQDVRILTQDGVGGWLVVFGVVAAAIHVVHLSHGRNR